MQQLGRYIKNIEYEKACYATIAVDHGIMCYRKHPASWKNWIKP